jgi:hypothetical protein
MSSAYVCAALVVLAACGRAGSDAASSDRVTKAAAVSNAIAAKPAAADSILKANGYTADEYQRVMFEIAKDSAESARYAAAVHR